MKKTTKTATFVKKLDNWRGNAALYQLAPPIEQTTYEDGVEKTTKYGHIVVSGVNHAFAHETMGFPCDSEGNVVNMLDLFCTKGTTDHRVALANAGYERVLAPAVAPTAEEILAKIRELVAPPAPRDPLMDVVERFAERLRDDPGAKCRKELATVEIRRKPVVRTRKLRSASESASKQREYHRREARNLTDRYCAQLIQKRIYQRTGTWMPRFSIRWDAIQAERERLLTKRAAR
jgi:hypothetical protein